MEKTQLSRLWSGQQHEQRAKRWLQKQGLQLIAQNYRCASGEIDLIMQDQQILAFIEVRYRRRHDYGGAAASVDQHKQGRILSACRAFLREHPQYAELPLRFDVIAIDGRWPRQQTHWHTDILHID